MNVLNQPSATATLWGPCELVLAGPAEGNPFREVTLTATFTNGETSKRVTGFYDGDGTYRLRFLPEAEGTWSYKTASNAKALDGITGAVAVGPATPGDHGPVRVSNQFHFRYADGTRYTNIGTTAYVWNLQGDAMEEETLATLRDAPFTKIRMCVFPKHYRYNQNEPELYPFALVKQGKSTWPATIEESGWQFDYDRPQPAYFRHLEKRIAELGEIGVEADLILLHPYDRWGFSRMSAAQDDNYLRYVVARLAAFPNVWWSMANEYDFMKEKSLADWNRMIDVVTDTDPHGHLLSNHNGFPLFDYGHPKITHASIQRPYTERAVLWREDYGKPVSIDECCYEGDIAENWGNITGPELVHRFWMGAVSGGYVTHGETYYNGDELLWWAKGGKLIGDSVPRIAFLRRILEEGPEEGLDPLNARLTRIMRHGADNLTLAEANVPPPGEESWSPARFQYPTGGQPHRYYLGYFGLNRPREVTVPVPPGERYSATLIDTWEMTETPLAPSVERGDVLHIPAKTHQALLLRRID
jgi:hypothetical protein